MNRILALSFCLGLALTQIVHADDKDKKHAKRQAKAQAAAQHHAARAARKNAGLHRGIKHNTNLSRGIQTHQNAKAAQFQRRRAKVQHNNAAKAQGRHWNRANRNNAVARQNNRAARQNNRAVRQNNRAVRHHRHNDHRRNVTVRNRNSWYEASRRFNWRHRHDRSWWRHHYSNTRFVLFGGGYYFWNNGYWYPAYGYDPAYSTYAYDEPIYGYNNYAPGEVISNVQIELQREGYYDGEIDGLIGPNTRSALARFQADNGLYITRAIDEPTLEALGLT